MYMYIIGNHGKKLTYIQPNVKHINIDDSHILFQLVKHKKATECQNK